MGAAFFRDTDVNTAKNRTDTCVRVPRVSPVERCELQPRGRLDDGFRLAVQPKLAVYAVAGAQLLARHGEVAAGAISHEEGFGAGCDENPFAVSHTARVKGHRNRNRKVNESLI